MLKSGARFSQFQSATDWLHHAGLCYKIPILNHAEIPLKAHIDKNNFKLYFFDIGLLGALSDLPISAFSIESDLFITFKGEFVENYFLQEFKALRSEELYSWVGKTAEVDFLYTTKKMELVPIEVKSGESGKLKSLQVFSEKYKCHWKIRCSQRPLQIRNDTRLKSIPLYLARLI